MLFTNQPLAAVTNEIYREKMAEFDPSFVIPREQKIKTMIVKSCKYNKHGYLGVTATWIMPNFEIKDVMLEINYVSSPHSSEVVLKIGILKVM